MHLNGFHDVRINAFFREDFRRFQTVNGQISFDPFNVQIMQQPGQSPFFFILPQPPCQGPHDRLRCVGMIEHPLILNILFQQRDRLVSRHSHLILSFPKQLGMSSCPAYTKRYNDLTHGMAS